MGFTVEGLVGAILSATAIILWFLLRDAYYRSNKRISSLEDKIVTVNSKIETEARATDKRINDLHLTILDKLDEIKNSFNDFRK